MVAPQLADRLCALCGGGPTPELGVPVFLMITAQLARQEGRQLQIPESPYLHLLCARKILEET